MGSAGALHKHSAHLTWTRVERDGSSPAGQYVDHARDLVAVVSAWAEHVAANSGHAESLGPIAKGLVIEAERRFADGERPAASVWTNETPSVEVGFFDLTPFVTRYTCDHQ